MVDQLYVARGDKKYGPFSPKRLRDLAAKGELLLTDTLWQEGMASPVVLSRVGNLFAAAPPALIASAAVQPLPVPDEPIVVPPPVQALAPPTAPTPVKTEAPPAHQPEQVRKRRAIAIKGAVLASQDGSHVQYRKKCDTCGHEEAGRSTMLIANGTTRSNFFCPKCRKSREVLIKGMIQ